MKICRVSRSDRNFQRTHVSWANNLVVQRLAPQNVTPHNIDAMIVKKGTPTPNIIAQSCWGPGLPFIQSNKESCTAEPNQ